MPSPVPFFADPNLGAGMEKIVPRFLYWKFFFRCICMAGVFGSAPGDANVTEARINVGLPHDGQNFFELSLHILEKRNQIKPRLNCNKIFTYLKQA